MKVTTAAATWSLSCLILLLLLPGCASVSVHDEHVSNLPPTRIKPEKIYVRDFDLSTTVLNVDRTGDELKKFKEAAIESMANTLIADLLKFYPTERLSADAPIPVGNYLLLEGCLTKVNQGSRALRMVVGFGAGGTKMETTVTLFETASNPATKVLIFDTTGGSGAEPGMASADPVSAGASAASAAGKGVTDDTKRTARMIACRISEYLGDHGWISPEQVKEAKKLSD